MISDLGSVYHGGSSDDLSSSSTPVAAVVGNSSADNAGTGSLKRKRKPSAKGLELQAEKGRKPSGKSSKAKTKPDCNGSLFEDGATDEYP